MDERQDVVGRSEETAEPSTADVLAEVERRRAETRRETSEGQRNVIVAIDRAIYWLAKHWVVIFNGLAFLYIGLPFLAPVLMHLGAETFGLGIYRLYAPLCHQLPQRSFFLYGPQSSYTLAELFERVSVDELVGQWSGAFVGNGDVGYKIALCQRDVAIYGTILLAGLLYGLLRGRMRIRPLPLWAYLMGLVPMGIDGGYQWITNAADVLFDISIPTYESNPARRVITGALFGLATVWLAYPYVQEAFDEIIGTLKTKFGWD